MLTFDQLRAANSARQATCPKFQQCVDWTPADWAMAITGEIGEACNLMKKRRIGEDIDTADIGKEIADVVIYVDILSALFGLDLGEIVRAKFNEVSARVGSEVEL